MTPERIELLARTVLHPSNRCPDERIMLHLKAAGLEDYRNPVTAAAYHAIANRWLDLRRASGVGRRFRADSLPIRRARVDV